MKLKRLETQVDRDAPWPSHVRRRIFVWFALVHLIPAMPGNGQTQTLQRFRYEKFMLGSQLRIVFYASDEPVANKASAAAFDRVAQLDQKLSNYRSDSELMTALSALHRAGPLPSSPGNVVTVSADLGRVLLAAQGWYRRSDGIFDPTVAPLTRLWKRAIRRGSLPSAERLTRARRQVGLDRLCLDETGSTIGLKPSDDAAFELDLGGIAKGYIADEALATLRRFDIDRALIDAGGDLAVGVAPPETDGWRIGFDVERPARSLVAGSEPLATGRHELQLQRCGVATSGGRFQSVEIDGKRYSHLVNPLTGESVSQPATVTVIASTAMDADALATCVSILGPARGLELTCLSSAEALVTHKEPEEGAMTAGFRKFVVGPAGRSARFWPFSPNQGHVRGPPRLAGGT